MFRQPAEQRFDCNGFGRPRSLHVAPSAVGLGKRTECEALRALGRAGILGNSQQVGEAGQRAAETSDEITKIVVNPGHHHRLHFDTRWCVDDL